VIPPCKKLEILGREIKDREMQKRDGKKKSIASRTSFNALRRDVEGENRSLKNDVTR
jgi:hypothetical protein